MSEAKLVQLIQTTTERGRGAIDDPVRLVVSYHQLDGRLVHEDDPSAPDPDELVRQALAETLTIVATLLETDGRARADRDSLAARCKLLQRLTRPPGG